MARARSFARRRGVSSRLRVARALLAVFVAALGAAADADSASGDGAKPTGRPRGGGALRMEAGEVDAAVAASAAGASPPLFLMLYAPWCGHCKKLHPVMDTLAELASDLATVARVDASNRAFQKVASLPHPQGFPMLVLVKPSPSGARGHVVGTGPTASTVIYRGPRTFGDMATFLEWQLGGAGSLALEPWQRAVGWTVRSLMGILDWSEMALGYEPGHGGMVTTAVAAVAFSVVFGVTMSSIMAIFMYLCCRSDDDDDDGGGRSGAAGGKTGGGGPRGRPSAWSQRASEALRPGRGKVPPPPPGPPPSQAAAGSGDSGGGGSDGGVGDGKAKVA
mmetsp:Transcript_4735/g.17166  ORF Transcript_4735/g.17166 Transcript_4735/m.17166 type:complete len:335 (-) Transcript_4735:64-1068(-)|eukprot:CAMPEP_0203815514 /NCGR_PEP_ID=MMETSP0115-20131106/11156_1 /ASSEMBLY_ACC=CAM_ASM_000227 /TAXON_ID=33651 /ORGANISM="Bicosoecid sp, Strain ms1" /LENGTH=334 /DNA_ID=CAMNT_0050724411 /DNA_START=103 /DNA_END=1107 /DNA_ORIENTATION=-